MPWRKLLARIRPKKKEMPAKKGQHPPRPGPGYVWDSWKETWVPREKAAQGVEKAAEPEKKATQPKEKEYASVYDEKGNVVGRVAKRYAAPPQRKIEEKRPKTKE